MRLLALFLCFALASSATLVVVVPYQDGMMVCADRRRLIFNEGRPETRDDITKIIRLGTHSAFTITGLGSFPDTPPWNSWIARNEISHYYRNEDFSVKTLEGLSVMVERSFANFVGTLPQSLRPQPFLPGESLFTVTFVDIDSAKRRSINALNLWLDSTKLAAKPGTTLGWGDEKKLYPAGLTQVWVEIETGIDKRFDKYRVEPLLNRFVVHRENTTSLSSEMAQQVAKRMIVITSDNLKLLGFPEGVSPISDCASIETSRGFNWIEKH